jgi:hypothetical protein
MGAVESRTCVSCFNPIEFARTEVLATSLCAKCAHARSSPGWSGWKGNDVQLSFIPDSKKPKKKVDTRILRTIIWDDSPRQVSVHSTYILEDISLEVIPDGEVWTKTVTISA